MLETEQLSRGLTPLRLVAFCTSQLAPLQGHSNTQVTYVPQKTMWLASAWGLTYRDPTFGSPLLCHFSLLFRPSMRYSPGNNGDTRGPLFGTRPANNAHALCFLLRCALNRSCPRHDFRARQDKLWPKLNAGGVLVRGHPVFRRIRMLVLREIPLGRRRGSANASDLKRSLAPMPSRK